MCDVGLAYEGTIIATLFKNGLTTDLTCSVTSGPPTSCEHTGSFGVVPGDLIAIQDQITSQLVNSISVDSRKGFVVIEPSN